MAKSTLVEVNKKIEKRVRIEDGVDEIIAVHLHNGGPGAGNVHIQQHPDSADAQRVSHILQIGIELAEAVVGQQIG